MIRSLSYLFCSALLLLVPETLASQGEADETVAIGLLLPDKSHPGVVKAAELAIDQANREGGYLGKDFRLVVRSANGFWGAGSKESVSLVYDDHVRAIIGSLDGRNGHLAEQVVTKSHLAYIECLATDPTLSQAFVPWFARVVPNDNQQAQALLGEIRIRGGGRTALLSSADYDTRFAVRSLIKAFDSEGISPRILEMEAGTEGMDLLINTLLNNHIRHFILPFGSPRTDQLVSRLQKKIPGLNIYGTLRLHMDLEHRSVPLGTYEGVCLVGSPHPWTHGGQSLMTEWYEHFAALPHLDQVYVYDAVKELVAAIRGAGLDREAISRYLLKNPCEEAVSGRIQFDDLGNRLNAVTLVGIKEGRLNQMTAPPVTGSERAAAGTGR